MATAFERNLGVTQGRIVPVRAQAQAGNYVFCLGNDFHGRIDRFVIGDELRLSQVADVTNIRFVAFIATVRGPELYPSLAYNDATALLQPALVKWRLQWGIGAAVDGYRDIMADRTLVLRDAKIDCSQLTGDQEIRITLRLMAGA